MGFFYLGIAIVAEVAATSALKCCAWFTKPVPTGIVLTGYPLALLFLMLTLRTVPVGVAYAVWAGLGVVLVAVAGRMIYRERLDVAAITGMVLVIAGVVVLTLFSKTATL